MYCSTIAFSFLAVTGALAAPHTRRTMDNGITVILKDSGYSSTNLAFTEGIVDSQMPTITGPFSSVELKLGKDVMQQDLRCTAFDNQGNEIVVERGTAEDVAFSDAGKGPWTFREPSEVSHVVCDPSFQKIGPDGYELRVILQSQATETGSQTVFDAGVFGESAPIGSSGPFETVELRVGKLVNFRDYRCQVLDEAGSPILVNRGTNKDKATFSDAGKGEWTFSHSSVVSDIICDPNFA